MRRALLLLALLLPLARAGEPPDDVDELALAALLVQDGHWDRAAELLNTVDPSEEGLDLARYHTLRGLVAMQAGDAPAAQASLEKAIAAGNTDPYLRLVLAQALLAQQQNTAALAALEQGGEPVNALPEAWLLRARAQEPFAAWDSLEQGQARFPDHAGIAQQRLLLLVQLGLFQEARAQGQALLLTQGEDPRAWMLMAEALRRGGDVQGAIALLEEARMRFPSDPELPLSLAQAWLATDRPLSAALILQAAAESQPQLMVEAAECFRRAGQLDRALRLNERVPEGPAKARQRLGLLLEQEEFERAAALAPRLSRLGLLDEDEVAYGLAYAHFRAGQLDAAEATLRKIQDPAVFRRATALRQAMAACAQGGSCF